MAVEPKLVRNVFSHSIMKAPHILNALQWITINHGVLMKLTVKAILLRVIGKIVTKHVI